MLSALSRPVFAQSALRAPAPRACSPCSPRDSVSLSAAALGQPPVRASQLARLGAATAFKASSFGGLSCFACCLECTSFVHYCTREAGHSGKHVCPEGHGW